MGNRELNKIHKDKIKGTCSENVHFEWQDNEIMNILLGGLPRIYEEGLKGKGTVKFFQLKKVYQAYSYFSTDAENF